MSDLFPISRCLTAKYPPKRLVRREDRDITKGQAGNQVPAASMVVTGPNPPIRNVASGEPLGNPVPRQAKNVREALVKPRIFSRLRVKGDDDKATAVWPSPERRRRQIKPVEE